MKISGVMVLRNGTKLGYPYELAIKSLRPLCDEVVVLVDPTSEDDTVDRVCALRAAGVVDKVVDSVWDMTNHQGHTNCEISVQTAKACAAATGDWIFSLQADEVLHENEIESWRQRLGYCEGIQATALEVCRLYFYGSLEQVRVDWSIDMVRFFKRGLWKPDVDGAMRFDPVGKQLKWRLVPSNWSNDPRASLLIYTTPRIYHYSRIGDPQQIAERVRNLDLFFHAPDKVEAGKIAPYDATELRKLDTYVVDHEAEVDNLARLEAFPLDKHPAAVLDYFRE